MCRHNEVLEDVKQELHQHTNFFWLRVLREEGLQGLKNHKEHRIKFLQELLDNLLRGRRLKGLIIKLKHVLVLRLDRGCGLLDLNFELQAGWKKIQRRENEEEGE